MNPLNSDSPFDQMAADYDRWFDEDDGKIIFMSELEALQVGLPYLPLPWLEIGVGSGRFAQALGITTGLDLSAKLLDIAHSRGIITLHGNIEDVHLPLESFGTIFLIMTLCFLKNPLVALQRARRILKPGGKIVVGDVPASSTWGEMYLNKKRQAHPFYKYANFYTYDEMTGLLEQAGFTIQSTISTLRQKPGQLNTVESPIHGYNKDAGFIVICASSKNAEI